MTGRPTQFQEMKMKVSVQRQRLTNALNKYSLGLGLKDLGAAAEKFRTKSHIIRICNARPRVAAAVRPMGGKVTPEQVGLMRQFMIDNPIIGYDVADLLSENFYMSGNDKRVKPEKQRHENPKIAKRIRNEARVAAQAEREAFYKSWDWRTARFRVLQKYGYTCMCCGAKKGDFTAQGLAVRIVVDHIKPLSKNWHLRLDQSNCQILCDECNMGKGAHDETDFRPAEAA